MSTFKRLVTLLLVVVLTATCAGIAVAEEPETLTCFVDYTWFPIDTWTGIIPKAITEATGIQLDVTVSTDDTQLGLMIASGDLPDLIYTWYNGANSLQLMNSDLCYSYEDLVAEYCPDWDIEGEFGAQINTMRSLSTDGKYYTLLDGFESKEAWDATYGTPTAPNLYYRKDILDAMGLEEPKTVDDMLNIFAKVKEAYPDMIVCGLIPTHFVGVFLRWAGLPGGQNGFVIEDGKAVYNVNHSKYYDAMKFVNSLYRKGYFIDENFIYTNENDMFKLMSEDKLFSMTHCGALNNNIMDNYNAQSNPDAVWYPCGDLSGGVAQTQVATGGGWTATYITKNCENPEAAIKLMRYLFTDGLMTSLLGREGTDWWYDDNGNVVLSDELIASYTAEGDEAYINKYQWRYAFGCSAPQQCFVQNYIAASDEKMSEICSSLKATYKWLDELNYTTVAADSDEAVIKTKLDEYIKSAETRMIMAKTDEEFDEIYNTMMSVCETIGLSTLETTVNAQIETGMTANK